MSHRPISYRAEIITPLLHSLQAGECCSVVGINGVGKTNLLQHLQHPEILGSVLPVGAEPLNFVSIDANLLTAHDAWGFYEGLAEALGRFALQTLNTDQHAPIIEAHRNILAAEGHVPLALRCCSEALASILAHTRLVIIFDEFDVLFSHLPELTLRNLRGLRDRHKYRLMYLSFTREPLADLRDDDDWDAIEPFVELLSLQQLGLGPLVPADAEREVERFARRHQSHLTPVQRQRIVELSGGHPALLRALTHSFLTQPEVQDLASHALLARVPALRDECVKIWNSFSDREQAALWQLTTTTLSSNAVPADLWLKRLVQRDGQQRPVGFSPLLNAAIAQFYAPTQAAMTMPLAPHLPAPPPPIQVDRAQRLVYYYGHDISAHFTDLKFRLIAYLVDHYGAIRTPQELAQAVYQDAQLHDQSDTDRVITLVKRVRQTMTRAVPHEPRLLHVIKGHGVRLGLPVAQPVLGNAQTQDERDPSTHA